MQKTNRRPTNSEVLAAFPGKGGSLDNSNLPESGVPAVNIFNNALRGNNGDHLEAAAGLVNTMKQYPDTRNIDTLEAVAALLREALTNRR